MKLLPFVVLLMVGVGTAGAPAAPAEKAGAADNVANVLQRIGPTEPKASLATFRVEPGFHVELAAAEPQVTDPVDVTWDEDGRMYVCELWNYPGEPKAGEPLGRIRLLRSSKGDGVYDRSTVFADNIKWPSGVFCWDGGVFVLSSPDLWYLKDTTGAGRADVKRKVLTGFRGRTYEVPNSPRWGLDNRIYLSGSYAGGNVSSVLPDGRLSEPVNARDFRFDPRTGRVESVSGGGEWGQTFDDWGDRFACDATHLVWHPVLPRDQLAHNPYLAVPSVHEMSIGEWTQLFPVSKPEPWKVARQQFWSRWVNTNSDMRAGRFPKTELAPHGFATSAAGITIYRGSAYGADYRGDAFIGEPANNVVIRLKLRPDGVGVKAERPARDAEQKREFLASTDNWFRPVNFANGPDGCLYVVAMYREIIEDETAIPGDILKHYDLYTGRDHGRILRVAPDGFRLPAAPRLGEATTEQLVGALAHPDAWRCETAQRLLYQRQDRSAVAPLRALVKTSPTPEGKIRALWTLHGLHSLDEPSVLQALGDADPHVREHGARLAGELASPSPAVAKAVIAAAKDADARVRFRAAFALGSVTGDEAIGALAAIAGRDVDDRWTRTAILAAVPDRAGLLLGRLAGDAEFRKHEGAAELLGGLADVVGACNNGDEISQVLALLSGDENGRGGLSGDAVLQRTVLRRLAEGLTRSGGSLAHHLSRGGRPTPPFLLAIFEQARSTARDPKQRTSDRVEAVRLLANAPAEVSGEALAALIDPAQPAAVQLAAVRSLSAQDGPKVAEVLASRWRALGPSVRPDVLDALFRRADRLPKLLDAIENRSIAPAELEPRRRDALLHSEDPAVRQRAEKLVAQPISSDRKAVIDRYRAQVLKLTGDPARGEVVFRNTCATCHHPEHGERVGPNLATLEDRTPGTLLDAILDPNREVKPTYVNYVVRTNDGQDLDGVIASETATSITLRRAGGGEDVLLRTNIQSVRSTGISLMPEGLDTGIDYQQMADLLRYLQVLKD